MKRINLSVNLEDNEAFEQEITNLIKAKTKEIARKAFNEELIELITRVVETKVRYWERNSTGVINDTVESKLIKLMTSEHLDDKIREKMDIAAQNYVDGVIFRYPLERKFDEAINKSVISLVNTLLHEGTEVRK